MQNKRRQNLIARVAIGVLFGKRTPEAQARGTCGPIHDKHGGTLMAPPMGTARGVDGRAACSWLLYAKVASFSSSFSGRRSSSAFHHHL